ncbi:hypothetical protein QUQ16_000191 [Escherichia coli]|nr:hypothetical protein [Escherichia coli]
METYLYSPLPIAITPMNVTKTRWEAKVEWIGEDIPDNIEGWIEGDNQLSFDIEKGLITMGFKQVWDVSNDLLVLRIDGDVFELPLPESRFDKLETGSTYRI